MPAPLPQNKYSELVNNHVTLRNKMALSFNYACQALSNLTNPGAANELTRTIDGYEFHYVPGDQIYINATPFASLQYYEKTEAYNRLDKFMDLCLKQLDKDYNI